MVSSTLSTNYTYFALVIPDIYIHTHSKLHKFCKKTTYR